MKSEINRSLYCIANELRYNYTIDELRKILKEDIKLNYSQDFLRELINEELFNMDSIVDSYNSIIISVKLDLNNSLIIFININYKGISVGKEIEKSEWMDKEGS